MAIMKYNGGETEMSYPFVFRVGGTHKALLLGAGHLAALPEGPYSINSDKMLEFPDKSAVRPEEGTDIRITDKNDYLLILSF